MTEPELEWLQAHYPKGCIITSVRDKSIETYTFNPQKLQGLDDLQDVTEAAKEIISSGSKPLVTIDPYA